MGLVSFVFSAAGGCLDAVCLLLDLNFIVVHTVVRTLLAVVAFIHDLPALLLTSVLELQNLLLWCLASMEEAAVVKLGSVALALEGLLESLKMVGYLSLHVLLRGKEQLCRGVLSMWEGCGIAVSLVVYFTNTVVNYLLIATQNVYLAVVSVWQTLSSPLLKVLELTLTSITFLYSCLAGTSAFLWSPCKLVLDFSVSLVHMFISVFILNVYGLALTVAIALTTTAYLNPELTRHTAARILERLDSVLSLRRLRPALRRLWASARRIPPLLRGNAQRLPRVFHHLYVLERRLWRQLSRLSSQIGLALRTYLHRHDRRVQGDGDHGEDRRGPPDGRAGDGGQVLLASSSTDRPLQRALSSSSGGDAKLLPTDDLLTLLKEQEDRKKCVICQDSAKTVVLLPCRHLCLCRDCTNILLTQPIFQQNCPLCRHMILNTMDVYL